MEKVSNKPDSRGQPSDPFRLRVPLQVRFCDLDGLGHINNANYLAYFEVARMAYCGQVLGVRAVGDIGFILAEATIRFRAPGRLDEPLQVGIRAAELRKSSFTFTYEVVETNSGNAIATGTSVQVWYDYERGQPVRIPEEIRQKIRDFEGWQDFPEGGKSCISSS